MWRAITKSAGMPSWRRARLKPDDVELLLEIARVEVKQENHENALTTLRKAPPAGQDRAPPPSSSRRPCSPWAGRRRACGNFRSSPPPAAPGPARWSRWHRRFSPARAPEAAARFLRPQCERFPEDYRLGTLLVFALRQSGETAEALTQTVRLWNIQAELPASGPAVTGLPNMDEESSRRYTKGEPPGMTEAFQTVRGVWYVGSRENGRGRGNSRRGGGGAAQDLPGSLFEKDTLCLGWFAQGVEDPAASAASLGETTHHPSRPATDHPPGDGEGHGRGGAGFRQWPVHRAGARASGQ